MNEKLWTPEYEEILQNYNLAEGPLPPDEPLPINAAIFGREADEKIYDLYKALDKCLLCMRDIKQVDQTAYRQALKQAEHALAKSRREGGGDAE